MTEALINSKGGRIVSKLLYIEKQCAILDDSEAPIDSRGNRDNSP